MQSSSCKQSERYSRQILFAGIGPEGQERIGRSHVALVGVGATGAAAAGLLARAGVGRLTLIDRDFVEESNLQRQVLYDEADAREALRALYLIGTPDDLNVIAAYAHGVPAMPPQVAEQARLTMKAIHARAGE